MEMVKDRYDVIVIGSDPGTAFAREAAAEARMSRG
jgi:hypothetical protein